MILSSACIRDVAMRDIRNQIIVIHKESTKRFDQLYRMLRSNPHLGHHFRLRSWLNYYISTLFAPFGLCLMFAPFGSLQCRSCLLQFICYPFLFILQIITIVCLTFLALFHMYILLIISPILLPWYCLSGYIFPMNIELSKAYYSDMFGSSPDLNPPVIIDELSDKLRSIVDNYRPLPSTTSFDYLRFVKEAKRLKYTVTVSGGENQPDYEEEREQEVTGSFIEFIKYA